MPITSAITHWLKMIESTLVQIGGKEILTLKNVTKKIRPPLITMRYCRDRVTDAIAIVYATS